MRSLSALVAIMVTSMPFAEAGAAPAQLWSVDGLHEPESVLPDIPGGVLYVSNISGSVLEKDGIGYISKLSVDGRILVDQWVAGLNAPKGLAKFGDRLYVADIDELVEIDIVGAKITKRYPAAGAIFLNDVATDNAGKVYVSDTATNTIWRLEGDVLSPWLKNDALKGPNGIVVEPGRLIVAGFGRPPSAQDPGTLANLVEVKLDPLTIADLGDGSPVAHLDGVASMGDGNFLATDYGKGPLYLVKPDGSFTSLAVFKPGSADLAFDTVTSTAYIPLSQEGRVVALKLR